MTHTTIVTSFGPEQWKEYAENFVDSYLRHWKNDLVVYYEHEAPNIKQGLNAPNVYLRDLYEIPHAEEFLSRTSLDQFKGLQRKASDENQFIYNFRLDANKFSRKVFSIYHAWAEIKGNADRPPPVEREVIAWCDADIVTFKDVPDDFVQSLLPKDHALAFMSRDHISTYPETGFWVADVDHPSTSAFMQVMWNFYTSGAFVFLKEWHDCYVLEVARRLTHIPFHNLSTDVQDLHVFIHTKMAEYMDHLKGPERKVQGCSPEHPHYEAGRKAS